MHLLDWISSTARVTFASLAAGPATLIGSTTVIYLALPAAVASVLIVFGMFSDFRQIVKNTLRSVFTRRRI